MGDSSERYSDSTESPPSTREGSENDSMLELSTSLSAIALNNKVVSVPKLDDATDAGTTNGFKCTLIVVEGDSAKALVMSALDILGRKRYGVFPLCGKPPNACLKNFCEVVSKKPIKGLVDALNLKEESKYDTDEKFKQLRYGKVMIMTDQDPDGSHIKGLIINFFYRFWPELIRKRNFIEEFVTPIVKATRAGITHSFCSIQEYEEWSKQTDDKNTYNIKYYKGLGSSTAKDAREYFTGMRGLVRFKYSGKEDDVALIKAFAEKDHKEWLTKYMESSEREDYLYKNLYASAGPSSSSTDQAIISYSDFVNKELVRYHIDNNTRTIPSLVDGFKQSQRKVLFTCFKRDEHQEVKVSQLAGDVGRFAEYHHAESSLTSTITKMAQDFVGANNINLLLPNGQFGSRLDGGKNSAAKARYIFTMLNPLTSFIFPAADDLVLPLQQGGNHLIEPEWYCPIIPMVLVNGADGIGSGYSSNIPNYDPRDLISFMQNLIDEEDNTTKLTPWYKNFKGEIRLENGQWISYGKLGKLPNGDVEITELPVGTWTQNYKDNVLQRLLQGKCSPKGQTISQYDEHHTDRTVRFVVKMDSKETLKDEQLYDMFKLRKVIATTMVLRDDKGMLKTFDKPEDICRDFFEIRKKKYIERRESLMNTLTTEINRYEKEEPLIDAVMKLKVSVFGKKEDVIDRLKKFVGQELSTSEDGNKKTAFETTDYDHFCDTTLQKIFRGNAREELQKEYEKKTAELERLKNHDWKKLWTEELAALLAELDKQDKSSERSDNVLVGTPVNLPPPKSTPRSGSTLTGSSRGRGGRTSVNSSRESTPKTSRTSKSIRK